MRISLPLALSLVMVVTLSACKRRKDEATPEKVTVPIEQAPRASQATLSASDAGASAEVLNAYVKQWNALKQRPLNDLNELVTAKILPSLPPAPAGKQFKLDVATQKVSLVDAGQ